MMHTLELLECALAAARQLGYGVRQEWLGGHGGGSCEIAGKKWLFLDLALSTHEQLELVIEVLDSEENLSRVALPAELAIRIRARRRRAA